MNRHIKTVLKVCFPEEHAWKIALFRSWKAIMGKLASIVSIESIRTSQLTLSAPNSCWVTEIHAQSHTIVERVNVFLNTNQIKRLRCIVKGTRKKHRALSSYSENITQLHDTSPPSVPPQIAKIIAKSFDQETQKVLIQYWKRCSTTQKTKST